MLEDTKMLCDKTSYTGSCSFHESNLNVCCFLLLHSSYSNGEMLITILLEGHNTK